MPASARDLDLRQHHGVETPEHVDVRFELAGVGSRVAAGLLDLLLLSLGLMLLWVGGGAIVSDIVPHGTASGGPAGPTAGPGGGTAAPLGQKSAAEGVEPAPRALGEKDSRLLAVFGGRLNELTREVRARIPADLVRRFEPRIPRRIPDLQGYL